MTKPKKPPHQQALHVRIDKDVAVPLKAHAQKNRRSPSKEASAVLAAHYEQQKP